MNLDEIEDLIRRYLSAGVAVVIILVAPATGGADEDAAPRDEPSVVTIDPSRPDADEPDPRSEADERDPDVDEPRVRDVPDESEDPVDPDRADEDDEEAGDRTPREPADDADDAADQDTADQDAEDTGAADPDLESRGPADGSEPGIDGPEDPADPADGDAEDPEADDRDAEPDTREATGSDPRSGATEEGTTAAERYGWGAPDQEDDFTSGLTQWDLYDGPGHAGEGLRTTSAVTLEDGVLTITGDAEGTTGGMAWGSGQRYGRWEGRVRAPASDPSYNALLLLWPDAEDFPVGGEIDFMEMLDPTRQSTDFFLHHGPDNDQVTSQVEVDGTEWHNWAVEWTPDAITGYVDGEEWFRTTDTSTFPPGPMHLCIQLDWFPEDSGAVRESTMEVDWVRQYALDEDTAPSTRERASTEPASGDGVEPADEEVEDDPIRRMFSWN